MAGKLFASLGDAGRGLIGLLYWNARKEVHRRTGRASCQNQSDDPVPGRVRCDAVLHWNNPGRFRVICPLLVATPDGWRCSASPDRIRPFWARAGGLLAALILAAYLGGTLIVFAALRLVGDAPVGWGQVVWPGGWREIPRVQSEHLFRQAIAAFREGRLEPAHLALEAAQRRDPTNYEAALLLAQITMFQGSFLFADQLFAGLQAAHPAHRLRTAVTYHDTLLGLDRMPTLARTCVELAQADPERAAVWMRSALLAVHALSPEEAADLAGYLVTKSPRLAPHAQLLLQAELDLQAGNRIAALSRLRVPFPGPYNPYYIAHQIERLAGLGAPRDAQQMLDQLGPVLGEFDHLRLQVIVSGAAGDDWGRRSAFAALLRLPPGPAQAERLAGLLITHPDAAFCREFGQRVRADPALAARFDPATLWVTAVACEEPTEASAWRARAREAGMGELPEFTAIDFSRRNVLRPDTALYLINTLSLPREVILALLWRTAPGVSSGERAVLTVGK